jgi:cobalamin-dependent methionine synthase I
VNKKKLAGLNVNYWRNRAEGMRVIAELMRDEQSKKLMFGIADEYDRMAESAERRFANEVQRPCRDPA